MQLHKRLARRSTCVAPLPSCGRHCGHMMPCGQHPCKRKCHDRLNSPCESRKCHTKVAVACDCDAEEFVWLPCWKAQLVLSLRAAGDRQWRRQLREDALRVFTDLALSPYMTVAATLTAEAAAALPAIAHVDGTARPQVVSEGDEKKKVSRSNRWTVAFARRGRPRTRTFLQFCWWFTPSIK